MVAAVPASAFWWQWPWKRIRRGRHRAAAARRVDRLDEQLLDQPGGAGHGRRARVAGQQRRCSSRSVSRQEGSHADDRHAALGPGAARVMRRGHARCASSSSPLEMLARPQQPPLSSRTLVARGLEQLDRGAAHARAR